MKNRKKLILRGLYGVIGAILMLGVIKYIRLPEYEIRSSFAMSYTMVDGSRGRDTDLNVIVYKNFNDEDLYKRVKEEHNKINGEPTELKINLYKYFIKDNEPYRIIVIDYQNNTEEIVK